MIILLAAAAVVVGAPIIAALLVSIASMREDAGRSLIGRAPNRLDAAVRRLLSFQSADSARGARPRVPRPRTPDSEEQDRHLTRPQA